MTMNHLLYSNTLFRHCGAPNGLQIVSARSSCVLLLHKTLSVSQSLSSARYDIVVRQFYTHFYVYFQFKIKYLDLNGFIIIISKHVVKYLNGFKAISSKGFIICFHFPLEILHCDCHGASRLAKLFTQSAIWHSGSQCSASE